MTPCEPECGTQSAPHPERDLRYLLSAVETVQARPSFDPADERPQLVALGPVRMFALSCYAPDSVEDEEVRLRINEALQTDERLVPHVLKPITIGDETREGFWLVDGKNADHPDGEAQERNAALIHLWDDQELGFFCDVSTGRWIEDPERKREQDGLDAGIETDQVFGSPAPGPSGPTVETRPRGWRAGADRRDLLIAVLLIGLVVALGFNAV